MEGSGGRFIRWLRGHSSLRRDRRATSTYRATNSLELRTSMLATTRILVSKLATAHAFCLSIANQHAFLSESLLSSPHIAVFPQLTHFVSPRTGAFTFLPRLTFSNDIFENSYGFFPIDTASLYSQGSISQTASMEKAHFSEPGWVSRIHLRDATI